MYDLEVWASYLSGADLLGQATLVLRTALSNAQNRRHASFQDCMNLKFINQSGRTTTTTGLGQTFQYYLFVDGLIILLEQNASLRMTRQHKGCSQRFEHSWGDCSSERPLGCRVDILGANLGTGSGQGIGHNGEERGRRDDGDLHIKGRLVLGNGPHGRGEESP